MQANPYLSIVIPTYDRADLLDDCLEIHIPLARAYNIQLLIFDNASKDNTEEIVSKRIKEYPFIHYHCNGSNVGPDENFELALKYPETEYVWLLGDSYQIPPEGIGYILNLISDGKQTYDVIITNLSDRLKEVSAQDFTDSNKLLNSLGALMSCLSCLIYNKQFIVNANFTRYVNSSFVQTGIIFEKIATQSFIIHWAKSISVKGIAHYSKKKRSWSMSPDVFEIACIKWSNFIFSLPVSYKLENKFKCLIDLTRVSGIFSLRHLLSIRGENILNYKTYKQYSYIFPLTICHSRLTILSITLLPRVIPRALKSIINAIRA